MAFKEYLKKNKLAYSLLKIIKNRKKEDLLEEVIGYGVTSKFMGKRLKFESDVLGKTYYIITCDWGTSGFFAIMRRIAELCAVADAYGFVPYPYVIDSLYNVPGGIDGNENMFEYYFEPMTDKSLELIMENYNYFVSEIPHSESVRNNFNMNSGYLVSEEYTHILANAIKKHFVLKETLKNELTDEIGTLIGNKKTVAVHFRGTGWSNKLYGHPVPVKIEQTCAEVDKLFENGYEQVFLATDDMNAINYMSDKYGDKLVYYHDVIRSDDNSEVQLSKSERKNDGYYLGREVLRDMYTLAHCDSLVAGVSLVAIFAHIQKEVMDQKYESEVIINNGIWTKNSLSSILYSKKIAKAAKKKRDNK